MAKGKTYKPEILDKLADIMDSVKDKPPVQELTTRMMVDELRDRIEVMRKKGWTFEQIAELMQQNGVGISTSTLQSYATRGGSTRRKSKGRRAQHGPEHEGQSAQNE